MTSTGESTPKRRKTGNDSFTNIGGYDSQEDSGDESFADHNTIARLPPSRSQNTIATLPISPRLQDTVATSPISRTVPTRDAFLTQPTQILDSPIAARENTQSSVVQVAASSPFCEPATSSPAPISKSLINPRSLANAMAPKGTAFRQPYGVQKAPARAIPIQIDEDEVIQHSEDSDDLGLQSNIKPSIFIKSGRAGGLNQRVEESPDNSAHKFKNLASRFSYDASNISSPPTPKRRVDDMASAYGSSRRTDRPKLVAQTAPARAAPVADLSLDDIPDYHVRETIKRMQAVLPNQSVAACEAALRKRKSNFDDALADLTEEPPIDLTLSDDEIAGKGIASTVSAIQPPKPVAKRQVQAPTRTIQDKWSSTQALPRPQQRNQAASPPVSETAPKPRRRLVKGNNNNSVALPSSPVQTPSSDTRPRVTVVSDGDSDVDSGVASESEDDPEREHKLLKFLNTCTAEQLADLSNQSIDTVSVILAKRLEKPFRSLHEVRCISDASTTETKSGKRKTTKKAIGEKVVEICLETWTGLEAIDEVVKRCEDLGKPVAEEMKTWGVDVFGSAKEGDGLSLLSLDNRDRDSGIGTPSSSPSTDDEGPPGVTKYAVSAMATSSKNAFLRQPAIMSQELQMKDYQIVGLNWLALLFRQKLSGILADDMGLGKTCQVIAFLSYLYQTGVKGPHLVVVPASTLENWLREFRMFSPSLVVEPYYGLEKERAEQRYAIEDTIDRINVIVTTYDLVSKAKDASFLRHLKPTVCVYDEGQKLKNSQSKQYSQCMRIPAQFRLLLTGTPLQNNLQELASLLGFIMPDVFKAHEEDLALIFKHRSTILHHTDHASLLSAQRIARARSMITPFMLRRKKHQVLGKHLPAKTRRVEYCELLPTQKEIYDGFVEDARQAALDRAAGIADGATSTNVLTDLRKAAMHPLLHRRIFDDERIKKLEQWRDNMNQKELARGDTRSKYYFEEKSDIELHRFCKRYPQLQKYTLKNQEWMESGKVQKLCELLKKFKSNGDRTIVFSQWCRSLNIIEIVLETLDMQYFMLTGDTPVTTRQDMIDEFYADTSIPVFLLSTGAGGTGINLACANKVIIFDSSFNPQEDIQAENRAHRVGQTREVEVVRLVTKGTVEESIYALGQSKLALDDRVAGEGATNEDSMQVEKQGEAIVEKMLLEEIKTMNTGQKVDKTEEEENAAGKKDVSMPLRPMSPGEVKKNYLNGLKTAGLDMSAA